MNAVADISRWQRTSQATVSVSASVRPRRGQSACAHLGAEHAMIAAAALGDVVQQHRDIERAARRDLLEQAGGERMILLAARRARSARAGRSRGSYARRPYNGGTCRTASARRRGRNRERSGRTRRPRSSSAAPSRDRAAGQHVEEQFVGARVGAHLRRRSAWRRGAAARIVSGWISSPSRSASANISISRTGSWREEVVVGHREPAAIEHEAFELARPAAEATAGRGAGRGAANFSSRWARNTPVRSPTVFACRK